MGSLMLPLLALVACADPTWSLAGTWEGGVICGSGWLEMSVELEQPVDFEASGTGEVPFTDSSGTDILWTFTMSATYNEPADDATSISLDLLFEDCSQDGGANFTCWDGSGTWDVVDDELFGSLPGFPIVGGGCRYEIERAATDSEA